MENVVEGGAMVVSSVAVFVTPSPTLSISVVSVCKRLVKQTVKRVEHCNLLQLTKVTEFWNESK